MNQNSLNRNTKFGSRAYVDFDLNFKPNTNGDLKVKSGENSVKQSILNLLMLFEYGQETTYYLSKRVLYFLLINFLI